MYWIKHGENLVKRIEQKGKAYEELSDDALKAKTAEFKKLLSAGSTLDSILVDAFATVRETARRVLGLYPYPVQLLGGIALHEGKIAEMKTGEGKTLVAALPSYLHALEGKGVHVVTVNDYLAQRDADTIGKIHRFLGLSVGVVLSDDSPQKRRPAYNCDITYITHAQLGFDWLRDNLAASLDETVQRDLHYAIIDEVDSILIDDARTPLIISGQGTDVSKLCIACDACAKSLVKGEESREFNKADAFVGILPEETGDFIINKKEKTVTLTAQGIAQVERFFGLESYARPEYKSIQMGMEMALRANYVMIKDKDYIVSHGEIQIVDEFTGRVLHGRQYSDGLHQAIQAKENVPIESINQTLASVTYQMFFIKYDLFAGMTGTAYSEKKEFWSTYHLKVVKIPTNRPVIRVDHPDQFYLTKKGKLSAVIDDVRATHAKGQPVLVATPTVAVSEELSDMLHKYHLEHQVLSAKQDEHEAEVISRAGRHGSITIATNMAGRGTDILLDEEAVVAGGLKVIGTERHESVRIDDQLRGRAGRQGDPGESIFYVSAEDRAMLFVSKDVKATLLHAGYNEFDPITSKYFLRMIRKGQRIIEENNFGTRQNVLDYDKINDKQRTLIYTERRKLLNGESDPSADMRYCVSQIGALLLQDDAVVENNVIHYDVMADRFSQITGFKVSEEKLRKIKFKPDLISWMSFVALELYENRVKEFSESEMSNLAEIQRQIILSAINTYWPEHLRALDFLQRNIWYMGYGQIDAKSAYALQAFGLYKGMLNNIMRVSIFAFLNPDALNQLKNNIA